MYIEIHCDGACSGNPGPGGAAAKLFFKDSDGKTIADKTLLAGRTDATNNIMELEACMIALKAIKKKNYDTFVYSDSQYLIDGINLHMPAWKQRGWKTSTKKTPKNSEMWLELDEIIKTFDSIKFFHEAGHEDKNHINAEVDKLAAKIAQHGGDTSCIKL
jgi:ribonuclease HI